MWKLTRPVWELIQRRLTISILLIPIRRLFGKRQLGQLTVFDLASLLLTANSLQPSLTGTDSSLLGVIASIGTLSVGNRSLGWTSSRFPPLKRLLQPPPSILARDGRWIRQALCREWIDLDRAEAALHHTSLQDCWPAALVALEADGTISVRPKQSAVWNEERTR